MHDEQEHPGAIIRRSKTLSIPEFEPLFTAEELNTARERLAKYGSRAG